MRGPVWPAARCAGPGRSNRGAVCPKSRAGAIQGHRRISYWQRMSRPRCRAVWRGSQSPAYVPENAESPAGGAGLANV
jgi:hypothetical protein